VRQFPSMILSMVPYRAMSSGQNHPDATPGQGIESQWAQEDTLPASPVVTFPKHSLLLKSYHTGYLQDTNAFSGSRGGFFRQDRGIPGLRCFH
jgi:hypothetical protein